MNAYIFLSFLSGIVVGVAGCTIWAYIAMKGGEVFEDIDEHEKLE